MSQSPYIYDVTTADFDVLVIENSFHKPVLVDFWADWCAPCKALMPMLASITESYAGELLLAKVNCDEQAALSERFGIRSLPTVVLFKDGQPVDGFAGIQPESAIRGLLAPYVAEPAEVVEEEGDIVEQARALIDSGAAEQAIPLLQQAITDKPDDALLILLARALAGSGQLDDAQAVLDAVKDQEAHRKALGAARAQLAFLRQTGGFPERETLSQRLAGNPDDSEARYQLAILDLAREDHEAALAALLHLFQHDRSYADNSPQRTLLESFELLGGDHPLTTQYRRRMYQALY